MSSFIHTLHAYIILLARYLIIVAVIGFMPVPLFSFLGGDSLAEVDPNPLFDYFNHYPLSTDTVIEHVFTNVYVTEGRQKANEWEIDNAMLWADALAYRLGEEGVPVVRHVVKGSKDVDADSVKALYEEGLESVTFVPEEIQNLLLNLKAKFELVLPLGPVTEDARQWIVLALSANQKAIKKQLKSLESQYPNDNFLVLTQNPVNLNKKTLQLGLPNFNTKQAKKALSEGLKITQAQAQILLIQNEKSLWSLNNQKGQAQQISFKSLLGQNYIVMSDLSEKEEEILSELCKEGKVKVSGKKADLTEYGVVIKSKHYQWKNENARINYQLQKQTLCGKAWIDETENSKDLNKSQDKNQTSETQQETKDKQQGTTQESQKIEESKEQKKTDKKSKSKERKPSKKDDTKQNSRTKQNQKQSNPKQDESIQGISQEQPQAETPQILLD